MLFYGVLCMCAGAVFAATTTNNMVTNPPQDLFHKQNQTFTTNFSTVPIVEFFLKLIQGQSMGAMNCKTDRCCGDGLRCDMLLHLCVPLTTPVFRDTEKACTKETDCSPLHTCIMGSCRFCGPRSCRSNMDCCQGGPSNVTFECVNIKNYEEWTIARDLGRITPQMFEHMKPHKLSHHEDIDSDELESLGTGAWGDHVMHGKRCWERCIKDTDCALNGIPDKMWTDHWGCCNGFCTRKKACVTIPENMRGLENTKLMQNRFPKTTF